MKVESRVCDECRKSVGNRITVEVDGKLLCSLQCGTQSVGKQRYLAAWTEKCIQIRARHKSVSNLKAFRKIQ